MKIFLTIMMCSYIEASCMPPYQWSAQFNDMYDCLNFGYKEAIKKSQSIGRKEINQHGIYFKFTCTNKPLIPKKETDA